jgi:hypothetical protein
MLDSNALDPLLDAFGAFEALDEAVKSGDLEILFTHVTVDELAATPDLEKRQALLNLLIALGRMIPTSGAVLDFSRVSFCRVMSDDDRAFEPLRSQSIRHSRDALIAHTALNEQCALITNEKRLRARARDERVEVLSTAELLAAFGFVLPPTPNVEEILSQEAILDGVSAAMADVVTRDQILLQLQAHELAHVHRFGVYLEHRLRSQLARHGVTIDMDYDYEDEFKKNFKFDRALARRERGKDEFRPDLIIHRRKVNTHNFLALEWKKIADGSTVEELRERLLKIRDGLGYRVLVIVNSYERHAEWCVVADYDADLCFHRVPDSG